ncbi:M23 family metallopeptidase [Sphingomonas sp. SM33]|jgi:murein DD-endopeptidase MepM/ murein hydrolase activator NlpD|uniref:M23 family metallopeptidase n=1 Tax=Sphingomonas telluris TaxID=2907998 RepID=A0ABS9VQS9_9SPHN|nr:M23 family metallopeptidase [Sphingomonas telluris]MCH8617339.1 M23 family metallopeptidase [Sphingomonas telluris]
MSTVLAATSGLFRDRDFFVHDGAQLRRFRLSATIQILAFVGLLALVAWSSYALARVLTPAQPVAQIAQTSQYSAQLAKLAAETERRVQVIEQRQRALAAALASENIDSATLERLGFTPASATDGRGGPFDAANGDPTFKQLFSSWKKLDNLASGAIAVPSDKPVKTAAFTSGYGVRSDPFRGSAAMHPGIDLAGPYGTPIYATADGTVLRAGWNNGGYGNLIEVDHGRGIATRYGHLSQVLVHAGDRITRGQLIARMGSTGRSTGSHLHYEVRIDGRPVNPIPFMKSTDYLVAMQKNAGTHSMDQVALGGPSGGK